MASNPKKHPSILHSLRIYHCVHCKRLVAICSRCDRGNHLCKACGSCIFKKRKRNNQRQSYHYHNSPNAKENKRIRNQAYYQANKEKIKARQQARRAQKKLSENITCSANACSKPHPDCVPIQSALESAPNPEKEGVTCHFCQITTDKNIRVRHLNTKVKVFKRTI